MKLCTPFVLAGALALGAGCKKDAPKEAAPAAPAQAVEPPVAAPATAPAAPPADPHHKVEDLKVTTPPETPQGATDDTPRVTGPIAIINGQPLDSKLFYDELDKILQRSTKIPPERLLRIKGNILDRLIDNELIHQAVKSANLKPPEDEVQREYDEYKKRFRTEEQFQNYLKHGQVSEESIKARLREKREQEMLLEKSDKLEITDAELKTFYDQNERFYLEREQIHARHVLVKVAQQATKEDEEKAEKKIKEAYDEIQKGMKFEDAVTKYSDGPSGPKGGDLGWFGRGQMLKPFEDKAFGMKPNEISEPVRTRFGFHVIQVLEKKDAHKKAFDEVKSQIKESLRAKKFFQERRNLLAKLRTEGKIEKKIDVPSTPEPPPAADPAAPAVPGSGSGGAPPAPPSIAPTPSPASADPAAPAAPAAPAEKKEPAAPPPGHP